MNPETLIPTLALLALAGLALLITVAPAFAENDPVPSGGILQASA